MNLSNTKSSLSLCTSYECRRVFRESHELIGMWIGQVLGRFGMCNLQCIHPFLSNPQTKQIRNLTVIFNHRGPVLTPKVLTCMHGLKKINHIGWWSTDAILPLDFQKSIVVVVYLKLHTYTWLFTSTAGHLIVVDRFLKLHIPQVLEVFR